jgi:hypothetical protein
VYACRTFTRGGVDEEERLMRRIMMTRRRNLREHDILQRAREAAAMEVERSHQHGRGGAGMTTTTTTNGGMEGDDNDHHAVVTTNLAISDCLPLPLPQPPSPVNGNLLSLGASNSKRRCRAPRSTPLSDEAVLREMDVTAVERTRSYRRWLDLPDGASFTYNQTFVRGGDGHDWLVRKSIWGRMRYQRKNRKKVSNLRARGGVVGGEEGGGGATTTSTSIAGRGNAEEEARDGRQRAARKNINLANRILK